MKRKIIIHAPNVHLGGGHVLLKALLENLGPDAVSYMTLDARIGCNIAIPAGIDFDRFKPSIAGRIAAELALRRNATSSSVVLCFGALPPMFRLKARVAVFIQNRNILGVNPLRQFGFRIGARIALERIWFRMFSSHADELIVQTRSMAALLSTKATHQSVRVMPFFEPGGNVERRLPSASREPANLRYDFLYVASGDGHKNHRMLVQAWRMLASEGIHPSLCLTINTDHYRALLSWITIQAKEFGLRIDNVGHVDHATVIDLYRSSRALIFPSDSESLGLPLIEARQHGLAVLAAELDYVRDILDPEETFDPSSPVSIARAVKRFLGKPEPALRLADPRDFIEQLVLNKV